MLDIASCIHRAGAWFLRSGIQEESGGVARYYRSDLGANALVSTEITGYAVSFLLFAHTRTGASEYRDAALRAARFLTRSAWNPNLAVFPFEHSDNCAQPEALAYFFDSGIIARGLLGAWRATGDREFLDTAVATGRGMLDRFHQPAAIHPILTLPGCAPRPYEPKWSASPGCYQLKSAMAWWDLHEETGDPQFLAAYESALAQALSNEAAFLPGHPDPEKVMDRLHAYGYLLEGILPCLHRPECAAVARAGIERVARLLREISPQFDRSDVYAQLLRARLFADAAGVAPLNLEAATDEAEAAAQFQLASNDPRIDGGFGFGRKRGAMLPFVNPVSTAFCAQTLVLWDDYRSGVFQADRLALV